MKTTSCETCPLALTCVGLMQGAVTIAGALETQERLIEASQISDIEAELADAYAVMAGELTDEESDDATKELNDTRVAMHGIDPEIYRRHRLESIVSGQKETEELILAVQNVFGTLALEGVSCHGPEVGLATRLSQAFDRLQTWYQTRDLPGQQRQQLNTFISEDHAQARYTLDPAKCSNKQAIRKYRQLLQEFPTVQAWSSDD